MTTGTGVLLDKASPAKVATGVRRSVLAPVLLTLAIFGPSSTNGDVNATLVLGWSVVTIALFLAPLAVGRAPFRPVGLWLGAAGTSVLAVATFMSPYDQLAMGALVPYTAAFALLAFRAGDLPVGRATSIWLAVANGIVLALGVAIVSGNEGVRAWLVRWYTVAYDDLVANMTAWRKPVFSFGSHSTAAFAYYLLFLLQWETWRARRTRAALVLAIGNATVSMALTSAAALGFALLALVRLALVPKDRLLVWGTAVALLAGATAVAGEAFGPLAVEDALRLAFGADDGGFGGRYLGGGTVAGNLRYVAEHPLRPIGLSYSTDVFYGDSGPVEQLLRGSIPLLVLVYGSLILWVRAEVRDPHHRRHLLLALLLFELGFSSLTFFRFTLLLPFVVSYLNHVTDSRHQPPA
jgi:hypothetical protein